MYLWYLPRHTSIVDFMNVIMEVVPVVCVCVWGGGGVLCL